LCDGWIFSNILPKNFTAQFFIFLSRLAIFSSFTFPSPLSACFDSLGRSITSFSSHFRNFRQEKFFSPRFHRSNFYFSLASFSRRPLSWGSFWQLYPPIPPTALATVLAPS
jgi:hypothetical protein